MRVKKLAISADLLESFLKEPVPPGLSQNGIPQDARVVGVAWRYPRVVELFMESAEFLEVEANTEPPYFSPLFCRETVCPSAS
jgi:hypothetical protein